MKKVALFLAPMLGIGYALLWLVHVSLNMTARLVVCHGQTRLFSLTSFKVAVLAFMFCIFYRVCSKRRKLVLALLAMFMVLELICGAVPYVMPYNDGPLGCFIFPSGFTVQEVPEGVK